MKESNLLCDDYEKPKFTLFESNSQLQRYYKNIITYYEKPKFTLFESNSQHVCTCARMSVYYEKPKFTLFESNSQHIPTGKLSITIMRNLNLHYLKATHN